ncbi:hypothetical protein [Kutzneria buriramensis]|uniref:hypothetical protein n=1 Tax=Kutzneria buriramensis TaxID=1045776 RepID=UPI0011C11732|nr:hypothetical protein [Kutzneria buriramensis]
MRSLDTTAAELPWVDPTDGDLMALSVHLTLEQAGSTYSSAIDVALERRLESMLTLEAGIAAIGGQRNDLAVRRAQRLVDSAAAEFLNAVPVSA